MDRPSDPQPFPLTRYIDFRHFRYYYAYGNTPAEDFLESVVDEKDPSVLVLGCGDIRSCFHTLWKNFDASKGRFNGVHFVLNDYSPAILARNIMFLYLVMEMSTKEGLARKKWIAAIWAIWFCHELFPEHERVLKDALSALLGWSKSVRSWDQSTHNPLRGLVKFATPDTLREIRDTWRVWHNEDVNIGLTEMKAARTDLMEKKFVSFEDDYDYASTAVAAHFVKILLEFMAEEIPKERIEVMREEVAAYYKNGSVFAESVLGLPLSTAKTSVNLTFFERADGKYTMHYDSLPYRCFFHMLQFSKKEMKKMKVAASITEQLVVTNPYFNLHPLLANSVQQFSIWLSSSAAILNSVRSQRDSKISFTLQYSDAIMFCQQLRSFPESFNCEATFNVIHSSNLIDHVSAPNLVLSALPFLKADGYLFTTTLLYKGIATTAEKYLETVFGFGVELLPVICGVRCIGHEDKYADSISPQPVPLSLMKRCGKQLIWQKVNALPLRLVALDTASLLAKALCSSISVPVSLYFTDPKYPSSTNSIGTETVIHIIQSFSERLETEVDVSDHHFWEGVCSLLLSLEDLKQTLAHLQTQALLRGLHLHLTVSPSDCPFCTKKPLSDFVGPFSITFPSDPPLHVSEFTPSYTIFIHKTHDLRVSPQSPLPNDAHIIDSVAAQQVRGKLRLDFYLPRSFAANGYHASVVRYCQVLTDFGQVVNDPTKVLTGVLDDFAVSEFNYHFEKVVPTATFPKFTFGKLIQHCGDGDHFESVVSLSDEVMAALGEQKPLQPKQTSSSMLEVSCGRHSISLSYPYDVDYSRTNIKLSRKKRTIMVIVPRQAHYFYEEKPTFLIDPDNKLSLPPIPLSKELQGKYNGMQFTMQDCITMASCDGEPSLMPTIVNLKDSVNVIFQCSPENKLIAFSFPGTFDPKQPNVQGLIAIHNVVFDLQNKTPAIDLSFCFLNDSNTHKVGPHWLTIVKGFGGYRYIWVDNTEYELVQKVFWHFASRTMASHTTSSTGCVPLLTKYKINRYFTRAVIYPLYPDPDISVQEMKLDEVFQRMYRTHVPSSVHVESSPTQPKQGTPQTTLSGPSTDHNSQCDFCGSQSQNPKKCAACGKAQYCGKTCQRKHWKEHKLVCQRSVTNEGDQKAPLDTEPTISHQAITNTADTASISSAAVSTITENNCSFCGSQSQNLKKCTACGKAQYCGKDCQRKHWKEHKLVCQEATSPTSGPTVQKASEDNQINTSQKDTVDTTDTARTNSATTGTANGCSFCGSQTQNLKKCTACSKAQYCGKDCQKQHWKEHKLVCQKAATSVDQGLRDSKDVCTDASDLNKCAACGRESDSLKKCSCHCVAYCNVDCQKKHWPKHKHLHRQQEAN